MRCPQPWPRPTTTLHHGGAAEIASAAHTAPSHTAPTHPVPVAGLLVHCLPQPAPGCAAQPNSLPPPPPSSLLVAARGSGAAPLQHIMHTARSSAVTAHSTRVHLPRSPPPHPLARHTLRHTTLETQARWCRCQTAVHHTNTSHRPPLCCTSADSSQHTLCTPHQAVVAATATHHTLPILVHCNAMLHTATPQCRLPTTRLGVPQLRRCGP